MATTIDLSGRAALVTGGGRGIGGRIARTLADAGADVVVAARTESELDETVEAIERRGVEGLAVPTDLKRTEDLDHLVETAFDAFDGLDTLVNNAGVSEFESPLTVSEEAVDHMIDVNFRGTFLLSQRFGRRLLDAAPDRGRIINISSGSGEFGHPGTTVYGGTKAGVNGLTRGLAAAFAREDVTVNAVVPGLTATDRAEGVIEDSDVHDLDGIPAGRLAEPEDVADACLYLASDRADYVTGELLHVNGGVHFTSTHFRTPYEE